MIRRSLDLIKNKWKIKAPLVKTIGALSNFRHTKLLREKPYFAILHGHQNMQHVSGDMDFLLSVTRLKPNYARIAQLVEHITDTDGVLGSNPSTRTRREPTQSVFL